MLTTQEPDALGLRRIREHLHTFTLARLYIVFLSLFKPDFLSVVREIHVAIRRVEAFLPIDKDTLQTTVCADMSQGALTGRTIRSGFPWVPPAPSPLAALRIISLACVRLTPLSVPIWPSWISARLNGWNVGAGVRVDINTTPLKANGREMFEGENRERDTESPRQRSICEFPQTFLLVWSSRHSHSQVQAPPRADGPHHSRCLSR